MANCHVLHKFRVKTLEHNGKILSIFSAREAGTREAVKPVPPKPLCLLLAVSGPPNQDISAGLNVRFASESGHWTARLLRGR